MSNLRAVMDANVLVAAFRSRSGASFEIFSRLLRAEWTAVLNNHQLFEYEEILKGNVTAVSLSSSDVDQVLNAICARAEEWSLTHNW